MPSNIARNVKIFGVDNSSSSHADNTKNNFLVSGECPIFEINGRFVWFCLMLHYKVIIVSCL